ncbi:hypothetical protein [Paenibacillus elgii]|uniref:hypothetical protein n=1 Tax=Paenibacillus elgii TaxID=189691 RepID=UPI000248C6BF|nr:hypothetical protein [Paenibacillus elgii]
MKSDDPVDFLLLAEDYLRVAKHNSKERSKWALGDIDQAIFHLEQAKKLLMETPQEHKWDLNFN